MAKRFSKRPDPGPTFPTQRCWLKNLEGLTAKTPSNISTQRNAGRAQSYLVLLLQQDNAIEPHPPSLRPRTFVNDIHVPRYCLSPPPFHGNKNCLPAHFQETKLAHPKNKSPSTSTSYAPLYAQHCRLNFPRPDLKFISKSCLAR